MKVNSYGRSSWTNTQQTHKVFLHNVKRVKKNINRMNTLDFQVFIITHMYK